MVVTTFLCDKCLDQGVQRTAGYALLAEETTLSGPQVENGEDSPLRFLRWHMLCARHHSDLAEEAQTAYVPLYQ